MKMIGHDDGRPQRDLGVTLGEVLPDVGKDSTVLVWADLTIVDLAEQGFPVVGDDGDKVGTGK